MLFLALLLSMTSHAQNKKPAPKVFSYEVTTLKNGAVVGFKRTETLFMLPDNQLWIEIKKDKYYASYREGTFFFFNLVAGTRHPIQHKKSLKKFKHSSTTTGCNMHYNMIETSSFDRDQYDICLIENKLGALPIEALVWLMNPTLAAVPGISGIILSLTPQSIKITNKGGIEVKSVLNELAPLATFKDDPVELWKLPLGKPCASRSCGQII